jgi:hypothetical protein
MFSLPLLYTMEVWWAGFAASRMRLLTWQTVEELRSAGRTRGSM